VKEAIRTTAEIAVERARANDAPAPDPGFLPELEIDEDEDDAAESLAREKAKQVWRHAKPFVTDCFELDRGENASIPEGAWWEQHAYMGMRSDMYANAGAQSFAADTTREKTPSGDSHRYHLKDLDIEDVRRMLRESTRTISARARSQRQLEGHLVAIDITKASSGPGR
jgi:putative transposase